MSLLPNDTFANPGRALYAAAGSGGGSTSSLQSPASIIADDTGECELTLSSSSGSNAILAVSAGIAANSIGIAAITGQSTQLNLASNNGNAAITVSPGNLGQAILTLNNGANAGAILQIGNLPNQVVLSNSSLFPNLQVSVGSFNAMTINGTNNTVSISGLTLRNNGSISGAITGQNTYQQVIGTVAASTPITITNPTQNGLYSVMMTTSASDVPSQQACIGVVAYWRNGVGWTAGGNVSTPLNALGTQYSQLLTGGGNGAMQFQTASTTPTLNGMGCSVVQLTGSIPGF